MTAKKPTEDPMRPFIDKFLENPEEYFALQVMADKLDELGRIGHAVLLRGWQIGIQPRLKHDEVLRSGEVFFVTHTARSWHIELFVLLLEIESGVDIDWHWLGGYARILHRKGRGNPKKVRDTMSRLSPILRHYVNLEMSPESGYDSYTIPGMWQ